jgi:methylmalonyl-CoA/ethylmalonyl-CoA epimerase
MADEGLAHEAFTQVALVVPDIEAAARAWAEALGLPVPEWHPTDPDEGPGTRYRDRLTHAKAKLAFFQLGPVSIELIEPVGGPSTWKDALGAGPVFHHVAFHVRDVAATAARLAGQGMETSQTGYFPGGRYVYVDSQGKLGVTLELLQDLPAPSGGA